MLSKIVHNFKNFCVLFIVTTDAPRSLTPTPKIPNTSSMSNSLLNSWWTWAIRWPPLTLRRAWELGETLYKVLVRLILAKLKPQLAAIKRKSAHIRLRWLCCLYAVLTETSTRSTSLCHPRSTQQSPWCRYESLFAVVRRYLSNLESGVILVINIGPISYKRITQMFSYRRWRRSLMSPTVTLGDVKSRLRSWGRLWRPPCCTWVFEKMLPLLHSFKQTRQSSIH